MKISHILLAMGSLMPIASFSIKGLMDEMRPALRSHIEKARSEALGFVRKVESIIERAGNGGSIADSIDVDGKLAGATTEQQFDDLMEEANQAYSQMLEQDPSRAIALQAELTAIKEKISKAKNDYFIAHPKRRSTPPSSGHHSGIRGTMKRALGKFFKEII